jgi:hypothetical protein
MQRRVHRADNDRRGVEGVEAGTLGGGVFVGREQRFQLFTELLPPGVFEFAGDRVREYRQSDGAESAEAGENLPFLRCGSTLLLLDGVERADGGDEVACLAFLATGNA